MSETSTLPPILYVDDEPANLLLFERYFEDDYQIRTAKSGQEALDILRDGEEVHLLITDQRMPGMNGTELLEKTLDEFPDLARMIVTAFSDVRVIIDAINKGRIDHYVTKPWDPDELKIAMDRALEGFSLRSLHRELFDRLAEISGQIPVVRDIETTHRPTVLYVDDEPDNLKVFETAFRGVYTMYTALSGDEALNILHTREIHVLIADQRMPGMTGTELLEKSVEVSGESLRILLTAYADIGSVVEAINAGRVYRYVLKPWSPDELRIVLDHALEVYDLRRRNAALLKEITKWEERVGIQPGDAESFSA